MLVLPVIAAIMSGVQQKWLREIRADPGLQLMTQRHDVPALDEVLRLVERHDGNYTSIAD